MALTLIANLDPGLQCRNTLNAVIDLVGANHPWTSGSIPYVNSSNDYAQDNTNFFWDATNKDLHIGGALYATTWAGLSNKATPVGADHLLLMDSASSNAMKTVLISALPSGGGGGGTTILDGSGPPASGLGSPGDYYVDNTNDILYGPKAAGSSGPDQIAIPPSMTPSATGLFGNYELGALVSIAATGELYAVRYWRDPATAQIARTVNVWTTGGTLLASGSTANDGGGSGWKQLALTTPLAVTAGSNVVVSVGCTSAYSQEASPTYPLNNGGAVSITNGAYQTGAGSFPSNIYGACFFVDAVFHTVVTTWPVAVASGSLAIGSAITGATAGSVLFAGTAGVLAQNNGYFFWDNTNKSLNLSGSPGLYKVPNGSGDNWFEGGAGNYALTGYSNFGTGTGALAALTTGHDNMAVGTSALHACTTGAANTAVGTDTLSSCSTGGDNVALGFQPLHSLTTGTGNVCVGDRAGGAITNGTDNMAIGTSALISNISGTANVAVGSAACYSASAVSNSIFLGSYAGGFASGPIQSCIFVGSSAGIVLAGSCTYNTFIGPAAGYDFAGANGSTLIGPWTGASSRSIDAIVGVSVRNFSGNLLVQDYGYTTSNVWSHHDISGGHVGLHAYNVLDSYNTPVNYERGVFDWNVASNVLTVGAQKGGTGTLRLTAFIGFPKAGAPAAGDLPSGSFALIDDTSGGATWLVFNKAGTIRKVQLT